MVDKVQPWKPGDPCPNCGIPSLVQVRRPTDTEKRAAARTDNPGPAVLGPTVDSASDDQHAELGDLFRCPICEYRARVQPQAEHAASRVQPQAEHAAS